MRFPDRLTCLLQQSYKSRGTVQDLIWIKGTGIYNFYYRYYETEDSDIPLYTWIEKNGSIFFRCRTCERITSIERSEILPNAGIVRPHNRGVDGTMDNCFQCSNCRQTVRPRFVPAKEERLKKWLGRLRSIFSTLVSNLQTEEKTK